MRNLSSKAIAAASVATIVISVSLLSSCRGRRMNDMVPTGETVEVSVTNDSQAIDSIPLNSPTRLN